MGANRTAFAAQAAYGETASGRPQDLGGYLVGAAHRSALARCSSRVHPRNYLLETPEGMGRVRRLGEALASGPLHAGGKAEIGLGPGFFGWHFCAGEKRGTGVGLTRKGKGTKLMLVTDGAGLPVGLLLDSAQKAEIKLAQATLETVKVRTRSGQTRTRPRHLVADKGYDSKRFRRYLRGRGIGHTIPPINHVGRFRRRRVPGYDPTRYAQRWIIERTNGWLLNYRRVLVRHDRLLTTYRAFVVLACVMITLGALLR
jgi:transposase